MSSELYNLRYNRFLFLLVQDFSMTALCSAIEPLMLANKAAKNRIYRWAICTQDGKPIRSSNGLELAPDFSIENARDFSICFICGGEGTEYFQNKSLLRTIKRIRLGKGVVLGGIHSGSDLLASGGLLDGYDCAVDSEKLAKIREKFPNVQFKDLPYLIDRDRISCAGGNASMAMMLEIIRVQHGPFFTKKLTDLTVYEKIFSANKSMELSIDSVSSTDANTLTEVVALMEANLEEPLKIRDISNLVGISTRQLERIFQNVLDFTPQQYYSFLRLDRARLLLRHTEFSITDIALACGFSSSSHFSSRFRKLFGLGPRGERQRYQSTINPCSESKSNGATRILKVPRRTTGGFVGEFHTL